MLWIVYMLSAIYIFVTHNTICVEGTSNSTYSMENNQIKMFLFFSFIYLFNL